MHFVVVGSNFCHSTIGIGNQHTIDIDNDSSLQKIRTVQPVGSHGTNFSDGKRNVFELEKCRLVPVVSRHLGW